MEIVRVSGRITLKRVLDKVSSSDDEFLSSIELADGGFFVSFFSAQGPMHGIGAAVIFFPVRAGYSSEKSESSVSGT